MPTAKAGLLAVLGAVVTTITSEAQTPDHLKCYRIKDPLKLGGTADLDTPQFGADPACRVSRAKLFCVPATKTNVAVTDKTTGTPIALLPVSGPQPGDRICYKVRCPSLPADQSVTDQFGNRTLSTLRASLVCTPAFKGSARFVDNGDGTVTDNYTGLQWEKKVSPGGGASDPHDVDNQYTWNTASSGTTPNGTAFTDFLGQLNNCASSDGTAVTTAGFAGHCDWRLPTVQELHGIVDLGAAGCGSGGPCIDPTFGPTTANSYHSATTRSSAADNTWNVSFVTGAPANVAKNFPRYVRAVRGGS